MKAIRIFLLFLLFTGCKGVEELGFRKSPGKDFVHMRVKDLISDSEGNPVVVLEEVNGTQTLHIWVGYAEARAIHTELTHQKLPRPMTHDLIRDILMTLGIKVVRVEVTDLKDNIFYARLYLEDKGAMYSIDSRPSDAIAISLRTGAPIYVAKKVLEKSNVEERSGILYIGSLGIFVQEIRGEELKEVFGVEEGVIVTQVDKGEGEKIGIKRGDVIVEMNGESVKDINDILSIIERGEIKEIKVVREGQILVLKK